MFSPERARYAIDFVAASVDSLAGLIENDIFGVDLVDRCAPARRVVFAENVLKIACQ
jgi:hypothetical protein